MLFICAAVGPCIQKINILIYLFLKATNFHGTLYIVQSGESVRETLRTQEIDCMAVSISRFQTVTLNSAHGLHLKVQGGKNTDLQLSVCSKLVSMQSDFTPQ